MGNELAVVVMSCDSYEDAWQPFYLTFRKYWHDCPLPVYFVSEEKPCTFEGFVPITTAKGMAWSAMLYETLEKITEPYILFLQEDFFLRYTVENTRMEEALQIAKKYQAGMLRLFPCPPPQKSLPDCAFVGELERNEAYRVSCQACIWEKETLLQVLDKTESIQEFEINGTIRSNTLEKPFLSYLRPEQNPTAIPYTTYPLHYVCTAIVKGKWTQEAIQFCAQEGISLAYSSRKKETSFDIWRKNIHVRTPKPLRGLVWRLLHNRFLNT